MFSCSVSSIFVKVETKQNCQSKQFYSMKNSKVCPHFQTHFWWYLFSICRDFQDIVDHNSPKLYLVDLIRFFYFCDAHSPKLINSMACCLSLSFLISICPLMVKFSNPPSSLTLANLKLFFNDKELPKRVAEYAKEDFASVKQKIILETILVKIYVRNSEMFQYVFLIRNLLLRMKTNMPRQ